MDILKKAFFAKFGLDKLSEEKREELIAGIGETFIKRVIGPAMMNLPEDKREVFQALVEEKDFDKILQFLITNVPNFKELAAAEAKRLQEEIKNITN
jgi:hypothetical protein